MDAICLLPDHIHCLFTMPEDESNYWDRLKMIKGIFTIEYLKAGGQDGVRSYSRMKKREAAIWQRRYWEHTIQDEDDYEKHFDYIHYHPVHHRLVKDVIHWKSSSFQRYLNEGFYPADWGSDTCMVTDIIIPGE